MHDCLNLKKMNTIIFKICLVRTGPYTHNTTSTKIAKLLIGCFTVKAFLEAKWPFRKQRIWRNKQFQVQVRSLGFQKKQLRWANTQGIFKGIWKFIRGGQKSVCAENINLYSKCYKNYLEFSNDREFWKQVSFCSCGITRKFSSSYRTIN